MRSHATPVKWTLINEFHSAILRRHPNRSLKNLKSKLARSSMFVMLELNIKERDSCHQNSENQFVKLAKFQNSSIFVSPAKTAESVRKIVSNLHFELFTINPQLVAVKTSSPPNRSSELLFDSKPAISLCECLRKANQLIFLSRWEAHGPSPPTIDAHTDSVTLRGRYSSCSLLCNW